MSKTSQLYDDPERLSPESNDSAIEKSGTGPRSPGQSQRAPTGKRKRDSPTVNGRASTRVLQQAQGESMRQAFDQQLIQHIADPTISSTTAAAALAATIPSLTVPAAADLSFNPNVHPHLEDGTTSSSNSFDIKHASVKETHISDLSVSSLAPASAHAPASPLDPQSQQSHSTNQFHYANLAPNPDNSDVQSQDPAYADQSAYTPPRRVFEAGSRSRPRVGTDEWNKVRKDNHKEVERRRRELINEGINELAKIVPDGDRNKGAVLQRGVAYIAHLRETERRNIERWTLEKMLSDQAMDSLMASVDRLKRDVLAAREEARFWRGEAGQEEEESAATRNSGATDPALAFENTGRDNEHGSERKREDEMEREREREKEAKGEGVSANIEPARRNPSPTRYRAPGDNQSPQTSRSEGQPDRVST